MKEELYEVLEDVRDEFRTATRNFPDFHSSHEGFAVLKEEVDELWDEVKANKLCESKQRQRNEAIQIAAMAIRFVIDCCEED